MIHLSSDFHKFLLRLHTKNELSAPITLLFAKGNKDDVAKHRKGSKRTKNQVTVGLQQVAVNVDHPGGHPLCSNYKAIS